MSSEFLSQSELWVTFGDSNLDKYFNKFYECVVKLYTSGAMNDNNSYVSSFNPVKDLYV